MHLSSEKEKFYKACEKGNLEDVKLYLQTLDHIDQKNENGWSGLIMAAFNGHTYLVRFLLDNGANVNDQNKNGTTIFMYAKDAALRKSDWSVLDLLLERGANINQKDKSGLTVLDYVKLNKYDSLLSYLISKGAV